MAINLFVGIIKSRIFKNIQSLMASSLVLQSIGFIKSFVVARFLGPSDFGILKSIELVSMLNKFGNVGYKKVVLREVPHLEAKGKVEEISLVRNVNYSADILTAVVLFCIVVIYGLFFARDFFDLLMISAIGMVALRFESIFVNEVTISKNFRLLSRITMITGILTNLIVILFVPVWGIYAVLVLSGIKGIMSSILFYRYTQWPFKFILKIKVLKKYSRLGFKFLLLTLSFASFKYSERLIILEYLDSESLGYYGFALLLTESVVIILKNIIKVRAQDIWYALGAKTYLKVHRIVIKETLFAIILSLIGAFSVVVVASYTVPILIPQYATVLPILNLLAWSVPILIVSMYTEAVTTSNLVNRLMLPVYFRLGSTGLLLLVSFTLYFLDCFTLESFVFLILLSYLVFELSLLFIYYKYFYLVYVKN